MENDLVNRKQLLDNILYEIEMVYINENLLDLNPNSIVKINEKNTLQFFTDITRKNRVVEVKIQDFYFFNDLAKKSSDIKFLLG
jgi:hypothetical protein